MEKLQAKKERSSLDKAIKCSKAPGDAVNSIVDILKLATPLVGDDEMGHILNVIEKTNIYIGIWARKIMTMPSIPRLNRGSNSSNQNSYLGNMWRRVNHQRHGDGRPQIGTLVESTRGATEGPGIQGTSQGSSNGDVLAPKTISASDDPSRRIL
ncbi:hypothetical protein ACQKWADRAFT_330746 [Trichoderma austrokoningii]